MLAWGITTSDAHVNVSATLGSQYGTLWCFGLLRTSTVIGILTGGGNRQLRRGNTTVRTSD